MFKTRKKRILSIAAMLALVLTIGGVMLWASTSTVRAAEVKVDQLKSIVKASTGPGLLGEGYLAHGGGGRGWFGGSIDYQQLLADALGITTDKLQAAYETARTAAIDQAVKEGLITQEQADEMLVWGGLGHKGFGFLPFGRGPKGLSSKTIDEESLLANALGITVDELQAAREKANLAAIDQAVKDGLITQEQADQMTSQHKLQTYLDRDALLAKALGMTTEELKTAYANGETLSTLMKEKGLDAATVREKLTTAYNEALAQAVTDGVITQDQADQMKNGLGWGPGFGERGPRMGGPGGFRGHGDWNKPSAPGTDSSSDMGLRRPGHTQEGGSSL
jgi:ribosomal protein S20